MKSRREFYSSECSSGDPETNSSFFTFGSIIKHFMNAISLSEYQERIFNKYVYKYVYDFMDCEFDFDIDIGSDALNIRFETCTFKGKFSISGTNDTAKIYLKGCTFNGDVRINGTISKGVNIQSCVFKENTHFDDAEFASKVRMQSIVFEKIAFFNNTKFNDLCDFWDTEFKATTIFYKTDFLKTAVFSRTSFYQNILFTYSLIGAVAIFRGATFKKGLDLSTAIINGSLNLFDFSLNDYISKRGNYSEDEYEQMISEDGLIPEKNKRETFRIIKMQFEAQKNHILALNYKALELRSHGDELKSQPLTRSSIENLVVLYLNAISNSHGKTWVRGVLFTLIVSLLFFYFTIISTKHYEIRLDLSSENICRTAKFYFEYLTPTHKPDFLDAEGSTPSTYFFDFLGRIFIAYGIYQTVSAFRKYRA
jgi:hypothetical protein